VVLGLRRLPEMSGTVSREGRSSAQAGVGRVAVVLFASCHVFAPCHSADLAAGEESKDHTHS
jgi:hypothetical protein